MKLARYALAAFAVAAVLHADLAFSQSQALPGAHHADGSAAAVTGVGVVVAPAGGGSGPGTVVAPDHPFPITCPDGTCTGGGSGGSAPFAILGNATISMTTSSARVALPTANTTVLVYNGGSAAAHIKLGDGTVTAALTDQIVPAGTMFALSNPSGANLDIAAILESGTGTLSVSTGTGSPFAAGGGGGAAPSSVTITGTLPAFAATPTFNLGTLNGAATAALQTTGNTSLASILTALASPFQAGGSIANTSFGISGTLPAFGSTPTFNLGTLNGAATAALQTTGNTSLASILTALASPFQAGGSIANTSFGATPVAVTPTDKGGTIATGGVAQNAMATNASRKGGWVQNPCSATEDLYVSTTTTATVAGAGNDADLAPCGTFSLATSGGVIQATVSVIAATSSHRWIAKEIQ